MPAPDVTTARPPAKIDPVARNHARATRILKWVRRAHMYTGLLMAPWILMYGASGFIFNHVGYFGGNQRTHFGHDTFATSGLGETMNAQTWADTVVARINARLEPGQAPVKLLASTVPEFPNFTSISANNPQTGEGATLFVDFDDRGGFVQTRTEAPVKPTSTMPRNIGPLMDAATTARVAAQFADLAAKVKPELQGYTFAPLNVPDLFFKVEQGGQVQIIRANLRTGLITARPERDTPFSTFLMRLHTLHHYPKSFGWAFVWAVVVDLSALLLCFWAITGIVMWFQMKNVRHSGVVVLILAALATAFLGTAVYSIITRF